MTRMTGPDCVVMCNLINTYILHTYIHTYIQSNELDVQNEWEEDLLSIPQSGGKMSKRLGGIVGCKYETSSWHLDEFPDGSNIEATI